MCFEMKKTIWDAKIQIYQKISQNGELPFEDFLKNVGTRFRKESRFKKDFFFSKSEKHGGFLAIFFQPLAWYSIIQFMAELHFGQYFFCSILIFLFKLVTTFWIPRMRRKFDDYPDFQQKARGKVRTFWETQIFEKNLPHGFDIY
jgi:hypothetical protein